MAPIRPDIAPLVDAEGNILSWFYGDPRNPMVVAMHPSVRYAVLAQRLAAQNSARQRATINVISPKRNAMLGDAAPAHPKTLNIFSPASNPSDVSTPAATAGDDNQLALIRENLRLEDARRFVMSMCRDHEGRLWISCEEDEEGTGGVQCFDPTAPPLHQWTQYTIRDGLGDNNGYAIACDKQDRIWVGHLNHGVSVFNHNHLGHWQCYETVGGITRLETLNGPIGERVFAIKVCPTDGDVWIATNCGLARYSESRQTWIYYTRADGLPSDEANSIAFDRAGNIYLATACDGVTISDAANEYQHWRTTRGPDVPSPTPSGKGLPTNLINDVLVSQSGTIYAATEAGLAWSHDRGETWRYTRGRDWAEKVREHRGSPPASRTTPTDESHLLAEDYCTALLEDPAIGTLWVGHRQLALEAISVSDSPTVSLRSVGEPAYVTGLMLSLAEDGPPCSSTYGGGIRLSCSTIGHKATVIVAPPARLPASADTPSLAALNRELVKMSTVPQLHRPDDAGPLVSALPDDWMTQGNWLGRHGTYWSVLAAMDAPKDYFWGTSPNIIPFVLRLGSDRSTDVVRYWLYRTWYTTDRRSLEIPPIFMHSRIVQKLTTWDANRRQIDWDDHGEAYPMTKDGPGLQCSVNVPSGLFALSLYLVNDDGHVGPNAYRDYTLTVRTSNSAVPAVHARVQQFQYGVYKRFLVQGPVKLTVDLGRNYSYNTKLCAVMLDTLRGGPALAFEKEFELWQAARDAQSVADQAECRRWAKDPTRVAENFEPSENYNTTAVRILTGLDLMESWNPAWWSAAHRGVATLVAREAPDPRSEYRTGRTWEWACFDAGLYQESEASQETRGTISLRRREKSLRWNNSDLDNSGREYQTVRAMVVQGSGTNFRDGGPQ